MSKSQDLRIKKAVSLIAGQLGANFEDLLRHLHSLEPEVVPRALHESQIGEDITIGTGIFNVAPEVKTYIYDALMGLRPK